MRVPISTAKSEPTKVMVRSSSLPPATLDASHRCDHSKCGARAYVCLMIPSGRRGLLPLFFCGHHFTAWEPQLRDAAAVVVDERWHLEASVKAQKG